jgi:hypothetical protein
MLINGMYDEESVAWTGRARFEEASSYGLSFLLAWKGVGGMGLMFNPLHTTTESLNGFHIFGLMFFLPNLANYGILSCSVLEDRHDFSLLNADNCYFDYRARNRG